jgi:hypothetical protein
MKYLKLFEQFNEGLEVDMLGNLVVPDCIMDDPNDDPDIAYEKGVEASVKEYDIDDNPYTEDVLKDAWEDGFLRK